MRTCDGWNKNEHLSDSIIYIRLLKEFGEQQLFLCHKCLENFAKDAIKRDIIYRVDEVDDCCG